MTHEEFKTRYRYDPATDKLGEGGFGKVFKAYDTFRDRWVAIKIAQVNTDYESIRLKKEVEMVNHLPVHPNIAYYEECYTFASFDGEYDFGILQFYEEGNLNDLLREDVLTFEQKQSVLMQILAGIEFLHGHGIIHRDLKPDNILIVKRDGEYIPKITDFGISKQLDVSKSSVFINSITGVGTLFYASPEQLGDRTIRKNADLWSYGVIAFQMLNGQLPFTTGTYSVKSESGRQEFFRQLSSGILPDTVSRIPEPWQRLIRQCLVTDPDQRIRNVQACKDLLSGLSVEVQRPATPPVDSTPTRIDQPVPNRVDSVSTVPADTRRPASRWKKLLWITGGCIIGLFVFFVVIGILTSTPDTASDPALVSIPPDSVSLVVTPEQTAPVQQEPPSWIAEYDEWISRAQTGFNNRDYAAAKQAYNKALQLIPATDTQNRKSQVNSKIAECDRMLESERKAKAEAQEKQKSEAATATPKPTENKPDNSLGIQMVFVKGGTFTMGCTSEQGSGCSNDEKPAHQVTVSDFYIGKYEVTQAQWKSVMSSNPSNFKGDNLPVEQVSWGDVQEFIRKLNAQTGKNYRLPTEAEWEYAARGGAQSRGYKYSGSNTVGNVAWYDENSGNTTHPVGQKSPNELGLYDMSGNVWEWCSDWYGAYNSSWLADPIGPSSGSYRVVRGGSWGNVAQRVRVPYRSDYTPGDRNNLLGFRLASSSN
jgi:formylglycine-generating enzyme required for sulfatase activity